jgi:hypothetical protein
MRHVSLSLALVLAASAAQAKIPFFNATCGNNLFEVHADEGGPVYINGHETRLRVVNSNYYEARHSHTVVSIAINPDGSPNVSYTRPRGNGICNVISDTSSCPADVAEANRWLYPGCN